MIQSGNGEVVISNDGATILKHMEVIHPAARMLVEISHAQDVEAGDGTTSVVVIAGALLDASLRLITSGIHPTVVSEAFQIATAKADEVLTGMATPLSLGDRETLLKSATTSLNSKVVSQYSKLLSPLAVDAVLKIIDPAAPESCNLANIKVVKKVGGTIDDTELVDGLVFPQKLSRGAAAPSRIENAKVALIQFQISAPKPDMENQVVITDYTQMDRNLREQRNYIIDICKKIKASGANVVLIQKSILRDAISDQALELLSKWKILVVTDIERTDVEFICKSLGCLPVAHVDSIAAAKLGSAALVEEDSSGESKIVKITGVSNPGHTVTLLVRGSNRLVVDEAERSVHDALCVLRCLVKKRFMLPGGGAPEIEMSLQLTEFSKTLHGAQSHCVRAFAEALEVIPYTLAENAGLNAIAIVTELRNRHALGEKAAGINVRKGTISNILEENVVQPLLVSSSAISLASECVRMILKIDDLLMVR
eukprot:TRINITY_DN1739_c0_g1_i1.p1 TRINITY_DN1739_c0_g1~~TRINITY_DN1739_c0_g1_i1.p1  ORF type:complete len:521 (-),score=141.07 TRINITY_DN1739_c0_g1_i1:6-1451(-)